jgi:hypothetical protein
MVSYQGSSVVEPGDHERLVDPDVRTLRLPRARFCPVP